MLNDISKLFNATSMSMNTCYIEVQLVEVEKSKIKLPKYKSTFCVLPCTKVHVLNKDKRKDYIDVHHIADSSCCAPVSNKGN